MPSISKEEDLYRIPQLLTMLAEKTFIPTVSSWHSPTAFPLLTPSPMELPQRIPLLWGTTAPASRTGGQALGTGQLLSHLLAQPGTVPTPLSPPGSAELLGKPEARVTLPGLLKQGDHKH